MFHVGQHVVCVETWVSGYPACGHANEVGPVRGHIYTIRENLVDPFCGADVVRLFEVVNRPHLYAQNGVREVWEAAFHVRRFRHLSEQRLAIFRKLLAPMPKQTEKA